MDVKVDNTVDFIKWFLVIGVGLLIVTKLLMLVVSMLLGKWAEQFVPISIIAAIGLGALYWLMIAGPGLASRD